jgi:hypothetical protein
MATKKRTTGQTMIYNTPHIKLNIEQDKPHKNRNKVRWVSSSCSNNEIRRYEIYIVLITSFKSINVFVENRSITLVPAGVDFQSFHCSMLL